ncbi:MAG: hypothetical protein KatS3mg038_1474 [Candidatus Kapaibacterium sp.]|nr:MAG: hypothetical protein KatS3mg038_1474 [Candidatus Kapabacteria bacterium]
MWRGWLAATASRSCVPRCTRRSSSAKAGSGSAEGNDYIVLGHDHATHETADGERRLSYRRNAAEIAELVGHKLRAWL